MESPKSRFETRIARWRPALLTLAEVLISRGLRVELDASDLVQQTLLEAHQHAGVLANYEDARFYHWLRASLRHNVLDAVKHLNTLKNDAARRIRVSHLEESFARLEEMLVADDTSPSERLQRHEQTAQLLAAIQELPSNQKTAVMLKHLQGCTLREVAQQLGLSEAATAGLLHRGRQRLVELLEPIDDE
jgi:RNA polymerase sigma-70 factor, ECF subfamily